MPRGTWALTQSPLEDGIVINYQYFGRGGSAVPPIDQGRTCTHEVGHYFNLDHIFGDDTGCEDDDITDTPLHESSNEGCFEYPYNANSSCTGSDEHGEMFMNYMDYVNDTCMNMFTIGQGNVMLAALNGERRALWDPSYMSMEENVTNNLEVSPNPAENKLTISAVG